VKLRTIVIGFFTVLLASCASVTTEPFRNVPSKARDLEDIHQTITANKNSIYAIYQQALRRNPDLRGKVVSRIVIKPSGQVIGAEIVASEINEPGFERDLMQQWKRIDFGAKEVDVMIITYPLTFHPNIEYVP
jgi:protein TonB